MLLSNQFIKIISFIKNKNINNGKRYYAGTKYPEIPLEENDPTTLPDSEEELQLHMQLSYKHVYGVV